MYKTLKTLTPIISQVTVNRKGTMRDIDQYLAELTNPDHQINISRQHRDFKWTPLREAFTLLTYDDQKRLLNNTECFLEKMGVIVKSE